jgi:cytochrome c oxidase subunit II
MERLEKKVLAVSVALMVLFFAGLAYGYRAYGVRIPSCVTDVRPFTEGKVIQRGEKDFEVQLVARMWRFDPRQIELPPGARVTLYLSTPDVVHGVQILGTNVNLMAVPGTVNLAELTFEREGEYLIVCHEYCGVGHQNMAGKIVIRAGAVVAPEPGPGQEAVAKLPGEELFDKHDCLGCHTLDGSEGAGPTFRALFGSTRKLHGGREVIADEAYLVESIVDPDAKVAEGYDEGTMPPYDELAAEDLAAMVEALRQLSQ